MIDCKGKPLDLSRPQVMGVLNITPDSFSDGGDFFAPEKAVQHVLQMEADGAAIRAGAGFINDVNALRAPGALDEAAECGVPVCLMHMQGDPRTMQNDPQYADVVDEVKAFLQQRLSACEQAGIGRARVLLDPGFGFGKTVHQNLQLLARLEELDRLGQPLVVGLSRKSMIGELLGLEVGERLPASIALAVLAVERGATLVRSHDVAATWQALQMNTALQDRHREWEN